MNDTISRNEAIKATLALCPQNIKPGSLDEYGATILCGVVDVVLRQLPAIDAIPVAWLEQQFYDNPKSQWAEKCRDVYTKWQKWQRWQKEQEVR